MDRRTIEIELTSIFRELFEDENLVLTNEMTANDIEKWDSLNHMLLIQKIQAKFNVKFGLKEVVGLKTVGQIIEAIDVKINKL